MNIYKIYLTDVNNQSYIWVSTRASIHRVCLKHVYQNQNSMHEINLVISYGYHLASKVQYQAFAKCKQLQGSKWTGTRKPETFVFCFGWIVSGGFPKTSVREKNPLSLTKKIVASKRISSPPVNLFANQSTYLIPEEILLMLSSLMYYWSQAHVAFFQV